MKKILVLFVLVFYAGICISQTNDRKPKRIELTKTYEPAHAASVPAEQSSYYGYDSKIKEILLKESTIEFVPKRTVSQSQQEYLAILNKWIISNPQLIKPDLRETEIK